MCNELYYLNTKLYPHKPVKIMVINEIKMFPMLLELKVSGQEIENPLIKNGICAECYFKTLHIKMIFQLFKNKLSFIDYFILKYEWFNTFSAA